MRTIYCFLTKLFFLLTTQLFAQSFSGKVLDKSSDDPLIGVTVLLDGKGVTSTDIDGQFKLNVTPGEHTITFSFIGYDKQSVSHFFVKNEKKEQTIVLSENVEIIETVVVSAGKFEQRLEETTVSIEVIKSSFIEDKNTTNIQTAIDLVPGVNMTDGQANIKGWQWLELWRWYTSASVGR